MPIISVFSDVVRAYNRVEVNWADTPAVEFARVLRVDVETGICTPLRPYICYNGDYLLLSCGHGIFWDTEVPLDRQVYYITEGLDAPCILNPVVSDLFQRTVVDGWGNADTGQLWLNDGGTVPANYDVNGTKGTHTVNTVNVFRFSSVNSGHADFDLTVETSSPVAAVGAPITLGLLGRYTDPSNNYMGRISLNPSGVVSIQITRVVAGVGALIGSFVDAIHAAGDTWGIRFQGVGSSLKAKAWNITAGTMEPINWQVEITDTSLTAGTRVGVTSRLDTGNLNGGAVFTFDNFFDFLPCAPCTPVTFTSEPSTMPSNGAFRLRDPVRPCNDIYMPLCFEQPNNADLNGPMCIPGSGVFFASMETESYDDNSLLVNPTNAKYPISMSRDRRADASTLTVVTRTFIDRDNVITLNAPGSPLLIQGPPQYGIPDRYMAVRTVSVNRELTNHKRQPRVIAMPFDEVARPAGPTQGVCGSRMGDLCDIYSTWDAMATAGLTWDDLIRGLAGAETAPGFTAYRTWNEVEVEFADWNAVDNGTRTWHDLEVGD